MKNHKKLIVSSHLATIYRSVKEIQHYLDDGNIEQAKNWLIPIRSAAKHIDDLTTSKKAGVQ